MIHFAFPFLLFLLPLPYLVRRFSTGKEGELSKAVKVPFFYEVKAISSKMPRSFRFRRAFMMQAAWIFLLFAAARPQTPAGIQSYVAPVRDLILILDISGSMQQKDFISENGEALDRLSAVKAAADTFVRTRSGDRIGIILFAGQASMYVPLTVDYLTLREMLSSVQVGLLGGMTAIGDALGMAADYLNKSETAQKVVVLLTDGVNNAGSLMPPDALKKAVSENVRVYTIGVGKPSANPAESIDIVLLGKIAKETGGHFYSVDNPKGLEEAYQKISDAEPLSQTDVYLMPQKELYPYPLFVCLVLLSVNVLKGLSLGLWSKIKRNTGK